MDFKLESYSDKCTDTILEPEIHLWIAIIEPSNEKCTDTILEPQNNFKKT